MIFYVVNIEQYNNGRNVAYTIMLQKMEQIQGFIKIFILQKYAQNQSLNLFSYRCHAHVKSIQTLIKNVHTNVFCVYKG